jgi:REP element-mobilizing transposase RayT
METELPYRKPLRVDWHDYREGVYFITCNTHYKEHLFGEISDCQMYYSPLGHIANSYLASLEREMADVTVDRYIVMPNHIHLLVELRSDAIPGPNHLTPLARVVHKVKSDITKLARRNGYQMKWQRSFYDHIIRNHADFDMISEYISDNVIRWERGKDKF